MSNPRDGHPAGRHDLATQPLSVSGRLAAIVESSEDAILSKDLDGVIMTWNRAAERIFGYSADEAVGQPVTMLIPPELQHEEVGILERIRRGERIDHYETVRVAKDGARIDISLTISPVTNAEGRVVGASKIARDISERKRQAERIELLAREAEHRVKNLLASVQAMIHLTRADTVEGFREAVEGRIRALANVVGLFSRSRWAGADLRSLAAEELAAFGEEPDGRAEIAGPDVLLPPAAAQAIAVTLHELATNAAKYGALSEPGGRVRLEWSRPAGGGLILRWTETGGPPASPPERRGFGTAVMEGMIEGQLAGAIRRDWRPEGLACEIVLPA